MLANGRTRTAASDRPPPSIQRRATRAGRMRSYHRFSLQRARQSLHSRRVVQRRRQRRRRRRGRNFVAYECVIDRAASIHHASNITTRNSSLHGFMPPTVTCLTVCARAKA